jgi:protein-S-isoprenylcysteine O-methyltransferase Ste14
MTKHTNELKIKRSGVFPAIIASLFFLLISIASFAQQPVEINGQDVGSWFERNWMWVTGAVVLLLLIILFSSRGGRTRKTTTVVKDDYGNVKSVTTTEEKP